MPNEAATFAIIVSPALLVVHDHDVIGDAGVHGNSGHNACADGGTEQRSGSRQTGRLA